MTTKTTKSTAKPSAGARKTAAPCEERLDQLFAWLDGDLPAAGRRAIERHLESCARCGGLAEDLRRAMAACRMAGDCRVPATIHRRARTRARQLMRRA
jgi:anti-sigma factor RsiW